MRFDELRREQYELGVAETTEQLNKLMDYLVGVKGTVVKHNDNWEFKHTMGEDVRDGVTYYTMSFHNSLIKYTVK